MKRLVNHYQLFLFLFLIGIVSGCAGTRNSANSARNRPSRVIDSGYEQILAEDSNQSGTTVNPNAARPSNLSLNDQLLRLPGVSIQGRDQYARIRVSGSASFNASTDPLFVLNGTVLGTDYSSVHSVVNPNDITSLSVLKGSDAAIYGSRGANGVILIRTK